MKKADFEVGDYVCEIGVNKVLTILEVEYYKELDDYVYYTDNGKSFGNFQLEPMEEVFNREYEKKILEQKMFGILYETHLEMTKEKQIEEILIEADAYGLRLEVIETASKYQSEGLDRLQAFEEAFKEWIK
jgi:hypothetical protein